MRLTNDLLYDAWWIIANSQQPIDRYMILLILFILILLLLFRWLIHWNPNFDFCYSQSCRIFRLSGHGEKCQHSQRQTSQKEEDAVEAAVEEERAADRVAMRYKTRLQQTQTPRSKTIRGKGLFCWQTWCVLGIKCRVAVVGPLSDGLCCKSFPRIWFCCHCLSYLHVGWWRKGRLDTEKFWPCWVSCPTLTNVVVLVASHRISSPLQRNCFSA